MLTWILSLTHLCLQNNIHITSQSAQTEDHSQHHAKFISVLCVKTHAKFISVLCVKTHAMSCKYVVL